MKLKKDTNGLKVLFLDIVLLLPFLVMLAVMIVGGIESKDLVFLINETLDVFSYTICWILFVFCGYEFLFYNESRKEQLCFSAILVVNMMGLFLDYLAWRVQGVAQYRQLNFAVNTFYFVAGPVAVYLFWRYIAYRLNIFKINSWRKVALVQNILIVISLVAIGVNCFTNIYFSVDELGFYRRTEGSFVFNALPYIIIMVLTIFAIAKSEESRLNRFLLIFYGIAPIVTAVIQIFVFGVSVLFSVSTVAALLLFIFIYIRRNALMYEMKAQIMYYQMQPHFIVNGMSSIRELIYKSPEDAVIMLDYFIGYLRGPLEIYNSEELISIKDELNFTRDYLEIQKIRFANQVQYEMDEPLEDFKIPAISIQTLVENSVRHGIRNKVGGWGTVKIKISSEKHQHIIRIIDDGIGFDINSLDEESHIGIRNSKQRISRLTGGTLTVNSEPGIGTEAVITIPR